jgi:hypothetical protein
MAPPQADGVFKNHNKNRFNWAGKIERFPTVSYEAGKLRVLKFTHLQLY